MEYFSTKNIQLLIGGFRSSSLFYNFLIQTIPALNIDINKLEKITKFKIEILSDKTTVSLLKIAILWRAIEKLYSKSDMGLIIAEHFTTKKAGIIGSLFLGSKDLKNTIEVMNNFLSLILPNISMKYYEVDSLAIFTFDIKPKFMIPLSAAECFIKICHNWILEYLDVKSFPIKEVHFFNKKPQHFEFYEKNYPKTKLYFEDTENYIVLNKEIFYKKNRKEHHKSYQYILNYAKNLKEKTEKKSEFLQTITNEILLHISNKTYGIETISKQLNTSASTLKRRLKADNTTFQKITEKIKKELSKNMLRDENLSLVEISFLLGYSEYSSFFRAFKKWHKLTPSQYHSTHKGIIK